MKAAAAACELVKQEAQDAEIPTEHFKMSSKSPAGDAT
jgi:hypothetical protein